MLGLGDLLEEIVKLLPPQTADEMEEDAHVIQLAVVGRPNVGKSSIVNKLLGKERVMVSPISPAPPATLSTAALPRRTAREYNIIDTAGMRRKRAVEDESLEKL